MPRTDTDDSDPTPVTIYGRTYYLRGGEDPSRLQELAEQVDDKMREVAEATGTADTLKIAILAALNIANDTGQFRPKGIPKDIENRLGRLITLMDEALVP